MSIAATLLGEWHRGEFLPARECPVAEMAAKLVDDATPQRHPIHRWGCWARLPAPHGRGPQHRPSWHRQSVSVAVGSRLPGIDPAGLLHVADEALQAFVVATDDALSVEPLQPLLSAAAW